MFGVIGDTTRGGDGRKDSAAVNYRGLNFREKKVWLPKSNIKTSCEERKARKLLIINMRHAVWVRLAPTYGSASETLPTETGSSG
jgi:hypothetical protein